MENKNNQDEFEQFLQDEVKLHRMYPSDHIWNNIRTELHGHTSWPALTFISLFVITALTVSTLIIKQPHQQHLLKTTTVAMVEKQAPSTSVIVNSSPAVTNYFEKIAADQITAETFADLNENRILQEQLVYTPNGLHDNTQPIFSLPQAGKPAISEKMLTKAVSVDLSQPITDNAFIVSTENSVKEEPASIFPATTVTPLANMETVTTALSAQKKTDIHGTADDFLKDFSFVSNSSPRRNSRFGFQFYITPSTSYRRLSDEKVKEIIQPAATSVQNVPLSINNSGYTAGVNNVVRHKPAIGIEAGFALLYNISNSVKLKTGFQLNIRQYYIETFQSLTNDLTSLSLINARGVETISFYSPYNNNTGYRKTQLDNKVYQISIPVGIVWEMIQGKHFGISSEGSVQPTMTLNNNTYLLSADYKHYTNGNEFIRKWNINTSVGLNLTYKAGSTSWQLGPQVRYQHLPTYSNAYPVKEYLLDYGVRLGFTRQIK